MKEINYKNLIDNKLSKKTKEEDGTAYVSVDGQYEEQSGYGYTQYEWIILYNGIMPLIADIDGRNILWSDYYAPIYLPENVSSDSVNKIRLVISGENNHDVTSEITYTYAVDNLVVFGNPWLSDDTAENNGLEYSVGCWGNEISMGAYDTFISNGDHVTIMGYVTSVKTIDPSLIPESGVFVKGIGAYSIQAKNDTSIRASGDYAVAEGNVTKASGMSSHAEGYQTEATGSYSHAEGYRTKASSNSSHAEGQSTAAREKYSHAEGFGTISLGYASHAEGQDTAAYRSSSHAEGGSVAYQLQLTGSSTTYTIPKAGSNSLIGQVIIYNNSKTYITGYSAIDASNSQITVSTSLGTLNSATCTVHPGPNAIGEYSHAEGYQTVALSDNSHAEGSDTRANGTTSHAEGYFSTASGTNSHAEGSYTIANKNNSHAEGNGTTADGVASHAECYYTKANGTNSHAEGSYTIANGTNSHAEGSSSTASGQHSHAEGINTTAGMMASHAEGSGAAANGNYSHAEGYYANASGIASHAEGYYTKASGQYQHAAGKYNVEDLNNTYAEIIGIGTAGSARKNGRTLDWNGNEQLAGSLTLGLGTTDQITVTAAQLKQLIALLGGGGMIINTSEVTINGHTYLQMDKTFAQIVEAYKAGQNILVFFGNETTTYCYYPIEGIHCDTTFETDSQNIIVKGNYFKPSGQDFNSYPICYLTNYLEWQAY